eukprot:16377-Heterococcus_DN1.PRE.2
MSRSARKANTEPTTEEQAVNNSSNSRRRPPPLNDVDEGEEDDGSTVGEAAGGSSRRRRSSSNNASGSPQKRSSMLDSPGRQWLCLESLLVQRFVVAAYCAAVRAVRSRSRSVWRTRPAHRQHQSSDRELQVAHSCCLTVCNTACIYVHYQTSSPSKPPRPVSSSSARRSSSSGPPSAGGRRASASVASPQQRGSRRTNNDAARTPSKLLGSTLGGTLGGTTRGTRGGIASPSPLARTAGGGGFFGQSDTPIGASHSSALAAVNSKA